jgi:hypothetical protein
LRTRREHRPGRPEVRDEFSRRLRPDARKPLAVRDP